MDNNNINDNQNMLVSVISTAVQIPGVKIDRNTFLREQFKEETTERIVEIIEKGPINAGCSRKQLKNKAKKIVQKGTLYSTGASFLAGIPGGLAMAATIPADMLQFYAVALRIAQEISYLYGENDLWSDGVLEKESVTNKLILYCGVMLGATGATQSVRLLATALAKQALKKLPQKALTKTFYYPIVKSIAKAVGARMTKGIFAKGVSKIIPIVGGVVSGTVTFVTLKPMGMKLVDAFDKAHFEYTDEEIEKDISDIIELTENYTDYEKIDLDEECDEIVSEDVGAEETEQDATSNHKFSEISVSDKIREANKLLQEKIITEEEFAQMKAKIISEM